MSISITITGETVEVVQRKLRDMANTIAPLANIGGEVTITAKPSTADALIAKGKEIVKKSEKTVDAPAPSDASSSTPAAAQESAPTTAEVIEYKTVGDAINAAAKTNKQAVIDLLGKYSAKRGTELKVEQYAAFMADLAQVA